MVTGNLISSSKSHTWHCGTMRSSSFVSTYISVWASQIFSPSTESNIHGNSPNAASQTTRSSFWKVEARVCLTGQPRLEAHKSAPLCHNCYTSHMPPESFILSWLFLAAVRGNRMWEWICRGGRGVWLWSQSSELLFGSVSHVCLLSSCLLRWVKLRFIFRSATRNAARSVPSPMGHTAVMAPAAITHVWYELGLYFCIIYI